MGSRRTTDSTDGFDATSWSRCHDAARFPNRDVHSSPVTSCRAASNISAGRGSDGRAERWRAVRFVRAYLPPVKKRSGKGAEGVATIHEWTPACPGGFRFAWRASPEPLPASVLPICRAGKLYCVGRVGGAGEHEGDGMVRGFSCISLGIPAADFEWSA